MKTEHLEKALERIGPRLNRSGYSIKWGDLRHLVLEIKDLERKDDEQEEETHNRSMRDAFGDHGQG